MTGRGLRPRQLVRPHPGSSGQLIRRRWRFTKDRRDISRPGAREPITRILRARLIGLVGERCFLVSLLPLLDERFELVSADRRVGDRLASDFRSASTTLTPVASAARARRAASVCSFAGEDCRVKRIFGRAIVWLLAGDAGNGRRPPPV
ncbi:MAG: hypothetical protein IPI85_06910 [Dehalococcoidia bacterium]|nr:hypothetical protein [Dehalococcoidia bacterium]